MQQLPDTSIWMAEVLPNHLFHGAADEWLKAQPANVSVILCRSTQQSLLRLLTTESVMRLYGQPALSNAQAWELQDGLARDSRVKWADEPPQLQSHWRKFAARNTASPKLWMDAYLAAFAVASGAQLVTTDKGFLQFPGLDVRLLTR